jgi:hypothetical protein
MPSTPLRIFIGSGEQSVLERKVLIYSLRKHTQRELDIYVFNGTHNAIERGDEAPKLAPLPLHLKYRNLTEFSLYRYLIPQLCTFEGKALYLDSDMVCLSDIGKLFDTSLENLDFLAKREAYNSAGEKMWGLSLMVIDCGRCRFDLNQIFTEIDQGLYTYSEFSQMGQKFLSLHPFRLGEIDPSWNVFDCCDSNTKLIHYTNLSTQPWKYCDHPYGHIWFSYLREGHNAGLITDRDLKLAVLRGYARPDLHAGNSPHLAGKIKARLRRWRGNLRRSCG